MITSTLLGSLLLMHSAANPLLWLDVPDLSMIRVGDRYVMSSTTMHMSPGLPIMVSRNLSDWKLAGYAYDVLEDNDALNLSNGKNAYGAGSWASSLRYHQGTYYVSTFSSSTGKTHIYSTKDPETEKWVPVSTFRPAFHDHSLFWDDDGRVYLVYGAGDIRLRELEADLSGPKAGGVDRVIVPKAHAIAGGEPGLPAEGSQIQKIDGKYYLSNICWPRGGMRTQLIHRADRLEGPYEGRVLLRDRGIAQGALVDTPEGKWYAYLFGDRGAVGRIPYLVPIEWEDGWPVVPGGRAPEVLPLPAPKDPLGGLVDSTNFDEPTLPLTFQWNHNPDPKGWSLTARPGFLRLTPQRVDAEVLGARNTLTQRTFGPSCTAQTLVETANLRDGDSAGLIALQKRFGSIGVKVDAGKRFVVVTTGESGEIARAPLDGQNVHLRIRADFRGQVDQAAFEFSLDGNAWTALGTPMKMHYDLPHFMGYRFGLFCFSSKEVGGFADFDFFRVSPNVPGG